MGKCKNIRCFTKNCLCYFFASVIVFYGKTRGAYVIGMVILLLYWFACYALGADGDPYSLQGWFGTSIDIDILGVTHIYKGEGVPFDPEGFMSTPAAIVQVIFGFLVGQYIQLKGKNTEMLSGLFVAGLASIQRLLLGSGYSLSTKKYIQQPFLQQDWPF